MLIEGRFPVAAPPQALLQHLFDARLMASCLPGCETLEPLADDRYRAVVVIAMAGIKARFDLQVEITAKDEHNVWATTRGEEGGNASTLQSESQVTLQPEGDGTLVSYRSDVSVTGRLGRFALGMMKKKAQSLGDEFAQNLQARLQQLGEEARAGAALAAAPIAAPADAAAAPQPAAESAAVANPAAVSAAPATPRRSWWQALLAFFRGEGKAGTVKPGQ
jgi:uncharacterized protein